MAEEIAKAIFLNNPEMIYKAYSRMLRRGNAYAFQVLVDRAFGKLNAQLEKELGLTASEPAVIAAGRF